MRRKVIQIADSTQLVSLPRKWALKYGIKKGDEVEVTEEGTNLMIRMSNDVMLSKEIEVKVDGLDKDSLIFLLRGLYIAGYETIKFTFDDPCMIYYRINKKVTISSIIHKEVTICQGMDIIQEKKDSFVLKNISVSSLKDFDNILRRIFLLLIDTSADLHLAAKNRDYTLLETFQDKHDNITRLLNYNLKVLNNIGYSPYKNTIPLFHLTSALDIVVDILKNAAREIIRFKMKLGPKSLIILDRTQNAIKLFYDLFFDFSFEKAEKFVKYRQEVLNMIEHQVHSLEKDDIRIIVMVEHCLEVLRDLYSSRIAMQY